MAETAAAAAGAALVEVPSCPLCGSDAYRERFQEPPYSVRTCANCGLVWVSPRGDEQGLLDMYGGDGYWRSDSPKTLGYADYRADEDKYVRTFRLRLGHTLPADVRGGRALDVGCAAGFCVQALEQIGFDSYGVEPAVGIGGHARDRLGADRIHVGTLETAPHEPGSLALVTMWDVVEHVVDPGAILRQARALLAPGGALILETQNADSAFARLLGPRWHHYKHAEHIYHFTPSTIRSLLRSAGFRVERVTPRYAGKYVSLGFIVERAGRVHPALTKALRPLERLEDRDLYVNVMDEIIVVARPA